MISNNMWLYKIILKFKNIMNLKIKIKSWDLRNKKFKIKKLLVINLHLLSEALVLLMLESS